MDPGPEPRALTLQEAAARHGAYRWLEHRLFEVTGALSGGPEVPSAVRVHLFEASAQHAWHAQLWGDRLPVLPRVEPGELTRPPTEAAAGLLGALGEAAAARTGWLGALAGLHLVVLPRLLASYGLHRGGLRAVADGPALRALTLVVRDVEEEVAAGDALLREALSLERGAQARTEAAVALLEAFAGAGGEGADLVPWPARPAVREGARGRRSS